MNYRLLKAVIVLSGGILSADVALAEINKCTTQTGKIEYRDGPCEAKEVSKTLSNKRENPRSYPQPANIPGNEINEAPTAASVAPAPSAPPSYRIPPERRTKRTKLPNDQSLEYLR